MIVNLQSIEDFVSEAERYREFFDHTIRLDETVTPLNEVVNSIGLIATGIGITQCGIKVLLRCEIESVGNDNPRTEMA